MPIAGWRLRRGGHAYSVPNNSIQLPSGSATNIQPMPGNGSNSVSGSTTSYGDSANDAMAATELVHKLLAQLKPDDQLVIRLLDLEHPHAVAEEALDLDRADQLGDPARPHGTVFSTGGYHNGMAYPALDDLALVVHEDEVGGPDVAEVHAERVHPEVVGQLGVAGRDVAGDALVEADRAAQLAGASSS